MVGERTGICVPMLYPQAEAAASVIHRRGRRGRRGRLAPRSVPRMDPLTRLRIRRLTRAVYDAPDDAPGERPRRVVRILPSPQALIALVVVLVFAAGVGLWRSAGAIGNGEGAAVVPQSIDEGEAAQSVDAGATESGAVEEAGLVVHVVGRVASPGVVRVPAGARVVDAIDAAGGANPDADLAALNLARKVVDGEQIVVPAPGEAPAGAVSGAATGAAPAGPAGSPSCIDLNSADASALEDLDGVGPSLAKRIVDFRTKSGPFASVDDLDAVPGIGPALLERIRAGACP